MEAEIQILRTLCNEAAPREERLKLLESCAHHAFIEPEHQIVFESICALLPHGEITPARLIVHLTNRGFPDIDVERYLPVPPAGCAPRDSADKN